MLQKFEYPSDKKKKKSRTKRLKWLILPARVSNHFGLRDDKMLLSNFQKRENISCAFHLVLR